MHEENKQEPFAPYIETVDETPILVTGERGQFDDLESLLRKPTRIRLREEIRVFQSFLDTLKDRLDPESATVYTNYIDKSKFDSFTFRAVANDCRKGAEWRNDFQFDWRGSFTKDFRDWLQYDQREMSQEELGLFLDQHIGNIFQDENFARQGFPSQMEVFNFVTTLEADKNVKFSRKVNIQNGDVSTSIEINDGENEKQKLKLNEAFMIAIQPFEGFEFYTVKVKLRFKNNGGKIVFTYDIEGLEQIFIKAREWAAEQIREQTNIRVCF